MKDALTIKGDITNPQVIVLLDMIQTLLLNNSGLVRGYGVTWEGKHETFAVETRDRKIG